MAGRDFKLAFMCISLGILLCVGNSQSKITRASLLRGVNGGTTCATCTVIVSLVEQLGEIHNETVVKSFERLCSYLPKEYQTLCKAFGDYFLPLLIVAFEDKANADVVCHRLKFCFTESGQPECHILPLPEGGIRSHVKRELNVVKRDSTLRYLPADICDLPGIKEICEWIESIFKNRDPGVDADKDLFSTALTLRGVSWRGKDCDDSNPQYHPGARTIDGDIDEDSNCNGIHGVQGDNGTSYEDMFCKDSQPRGVVLLGDSVGAHFHLPEEWFDATKISLEGACEYSGVNDAFKDLTFILENEIDWPEFSATTGYKNSTYAVTTGPTQSIYNYMWQRNRCNHRDYQNIAVNGAASGSMIGNIIQSMARNPATDNPLLVIYSLVGNDVCNGHPDTFAHMTTPAEMLQTFTKTLQYLDAHLPADSHLMVSGLVDGRVLYDTLHARIHPIGRLRNDVTYAMLYDYLDCLQVSPCSGWLTSNETVRNMTTERAWQLNAVLKNVSANYNPVNFDIKYTGFPIPEAIKRWEAMGGQAWQLMEPVDGFHTSQTGQALTAEVFWETLAINYTAFIGPVNPHNKDIENVFGDQGGYE